MADANNGHKGSFTRKLIEVRVTLRTGKFKDGNTKIITEVPIKVRIEKTGPPDYCKAAIEMRGLIYDAMAQMSTLAFKPLHTARNMVSVLVGDEENGLAQAFSGSITQAAADFNSAPDVTFKIEAMTGFFGAITPQGPSAIKGAQPASDFIAKQAKAAGFEFENDGVSTQLKNAAFSGSPVAQARAAARQIGAELIIDDGKMILMPAGGAGNKAGGGRGNAVLLKKETGLLGYPVLTNEGVQFKALYNPAFRLGGMVKLESIVPKASGVWRITKLTHELVAFDPKGGAWQSQMTAYYPNSLKGMQASLKGAAI